MKIEYIAHNTFIGTNIRAKKLFYVIGKTFELIHTFHDGTIVFKFV